MSFIIISAYDQSVAFMQSVYEIKVSLSITFDQSIVSVLSASGIKMSLSISFAKDQSVLSVHSIWEKLFLPITISRWINILLIVHFCLGKYRFSLNNFWIHHINNNIYQPNMCIGLMSRVSANGPGDQGSIPGQVIPKIQKMVLDATLLSTQHYKVRIKGKVEQS